MTGPWPPRMWPESWRSNERGGKMSSGHAAYHHSTTAMFGHDANGRSAADRQPSRLGGTEAWAIWLLATLFVVWLFSIQTGYGIVSRSIQQDAGLSISQIAFAASIYTWALPPSSGQAVSAVVMFTV